MIFFIVFVVEEQRLRHPNFKRKHIFDIVKKANRRAGIIKFWFTSGKYLMMPKDEHFVCMYLWWNGQCWNMGPLLAGVYLPGRICDALEKVSTWTLFVSGLLSLKNTFIKVYIQILEQSFFIKVDIMNCSPAPHL